MGAARQGVAAAQQAPHLDADCMTLLNSTQLGVVHADCLDTLRALPDACIDLIYIDPPFCTGNIQRMQRIRTGAGDGVRGGFGGRTYQFEVISDRGYRDDLPLPEYLDFLGVRLVEMRRCLTATGSIYVHVDWHASHHVRFLLDEIFGHERFLNEVIWSYDYGGRARDKWPRKHDNIYWYAKSDSWTFNREDIDRLPYMAPGLVGPEKAARGKLPTDVWWMTIVPTNGKERCGYPNQKPLKLVERIITASSNRGEVVADFFGGSGTTAVAARKLGRRFLLVDTNPEAIAVAESRLAVVAQLPLGA